MIVMHQKINLPSFEDDKLIFKSENDDLFFTFNWN